MKRVITTTIAAGSLAMALAAAAVTQPGLAAAASSSSTVSNVSAVASPTAQAGVAQSGTAAQAASAGQRKPGVSGQVTAVSGNTLTVQDQRQQTAVSVTMTDTTQVFKQSTVDSSSLKTGVTISASGSTQNGVFTATKVQLGVTSSPSERSSAPSTTAPSTTTPSTTTAPSGKKAGNRVSGTVTQVSGSTITVQAADGTTTQVQLGTSATITERVAATKADITTGTRISVRGTMASNVVTATSIDILPATAAQPAAKAS